MPRLLIWTVMTCLATTLAIACACLVGRLGRNPAEQTWSLTWDEHGQACWHQICPGITPVEQAEKTLQSDNLVANLREDYVMTISEDHWNLIPYTSFVGSFVKIYTDASGQPH